MEGASKDAWQTNTPQPSKKDRTYVKIDAFARPTPGAVAVALVRGDGGLEEGCVETVEGSKVLQSEGTVLFIFPRGPGPPDHLVSSRDAAVS